VKIETDTSNLTHGDVIVVETEKDGCAAIYAGKINTVEMHGVVDVGFNFDGEYEVISTEQDNQWVRRFENSQYELYLRSKLEKNGKVNITGL